MICCQLIPKKTNKCKEKIPRERKKMLNRIKMLKRQRHNTKNRNDRIKLEECITETEKRLTEHRKQEKNKNEKRVIENMKENPKILFDYIKKQKIRDNKIGPFKRGKEYVYDIDEICKMLVEQYNAQFSKHININKVTKNEIEDTSEGDLVDIQFDESDIANAINKLKKNSAAGPDGVPAILLINTKDAIKKP